MFRNIDVPKGTKFGYWTSLEDYQSGSPILCECICGLRKYHRVGDLRHKRGSRSCGCMKMKLSLQTKNDHGHAGRIKSPTYQSWQHMKDRCNNPKNNRYIHYGGRGITYNPEWEDFNNFLKDMGERPEGMSLDRINNNKGYGPDNCRWASPGQQGSNKRTLEYVRDNLGRFTKIVILDE